MPNKYVPHIPAMKGKNSADNIIQSNLPNVEWEMHPKNPEFEMRRIRLLELRHTCGKWQPVLSIDTSTSERYSFCWPASKGDGSHTQLQGPDDRVESPKSQVYMPMVGCVYDVRACITPP